MNGIGIYNYLRSQCTVDGTITGKVDPKVGLYNAISKGLYLGAACLLMGYPKALFGRFGSSLPFNTLTLRVACAAGCAAISYLLRPKNFKLNFFVTLNTGEKILIDNIDTTQNLTVVKEIIFAKKGYAIKEQIIRNDFGGDLNEKTQISDCRFILKTIPLFVKVKQASHTNTLTLPNLSSSLLMTTIFTVKTLTGKIFTIENVDLNQDCNQIKKIFRDNEGIPTEMQRLIWSGKTLEDNIPLNTYKLSHPREDETLHLVLRLRTEKYSYSELNEVFCEFLKKSTTLEREKTRQSTEDYWDQLPIQEQIQLKQQYQYPST